YAEPSFTLTKSESSIPMANPGQVITSGSKRTRTSTMASTTMRQEKTIHLPVSGVNPKRRKQATKSKPVVTSIRGYIGEIGSLQERHFPPSQIQPRIGTLS